jgi:hypothetical protein
MSWGTSGPLAFQVKHSIRMGCALNFKCSLELEPCVSKTDWSGCSQLKAVKRRRHAGLFGVYGLASYLLRGTTSILSERQRISSTDDWRLILGHVGLCGEIIKARSAVGINGFTNRWIWVWFFSDAGSTVVLTPVFFIRFCLFFAPEISLYP